MPMSNSDYVVVELNWYTKLFVPRVELPSVVTLLGNCRMVDGDKHSTKPIDFNITQADPTLIEEVTEREKKLIEERDKKNQDWCKEYTEKQKLQEELKKQKKLQEDYEGSPEWLAFAARKIEEANMRRDEGDE